MAKIRLSRFGLKFKAFLFYFFWIFPAIGCGLAGYEYWNHSGNLSAESLITLVGGLFAFSFFVQRQKLDESKFFFDAFASFNDRYNKLNEVALDQILISRSVSNDNRKILNEYFNLCAEEYLLYKKGYIPEEVWRSWLAGMCQYWRIPEIQAEWRQELLGMSHYGFDPESEFKPFHLDEGVHSVPTDEIQRKKIA